MKYPAIAVLSLALLSGCQNQNSIASNFTALTSGFFKTADEKQIEKVYQSLREGNMERAEIEAAQISIPFEKARAYWKIAHYEINELNDLIGAKKLMDKMENTIKEITSKEDRMYSLIELADLKHFISREESHDLLKQLHPEIWSIVDPWERSKLLIRLVTLELETQGDVKKAKGTISQTEQTIQFIKKDSLRSTREKELSNVLQVNNHILCKDLP